MGISEKHFKFHEKKTAKVLEPRRDRIQLYLIDLLLLLKFPPSHNPTDAAVVRDWRVNVRPSARSESVRVVGSLRRVAEAGSDPLQETLIVSVGRFGRFRFRVSGGFSMKRRGLK